MYGHFIVPVDLSDRNATAIHTARQLARLTRGRVTLLHVVETLDLPYDEVADFYERLEESAAGKLEDLLKQLQDPDVEIERRIVFGDPAAEIIEFAQDSADSLIVLRSHRVDPSAPTHGWATLSYKLAILANSPILLVKDGAPE
ncbi:MAG: universal stress protein [Gemmatimonadota bacterium]